MKGVIVGIFVKIEDDFLHFRENSDVIEKFSVFLVVI